MPPLLLHNLRRGGGRTKSSLILALNGFERFDMKCSCRCLLGLALFLSTSSLLLITPNTGDAQTSSSSPEGHGATNFSTPTPTPTATPTPTNTPTSTPTFTPTPTPTPTPPQNCQYFDLTGWSDGSGGRSAPRSSVSWMDGSHWGKLTFEAMGPHRPESRMPACLTAILSAHNVNLTSRIRGNFDDWGLARFLNNLGMAYFNTLTAEQRTAYNRLMWGNNYALRGMLADSRWSSRYMDRFILDSNCQVVPYPAPSEICGRYVFRWDSTPIGLVFDDSETTLDATIVEFDLAPGKYSEPRYSIWRASGGFPLLAFDPRKTGKVDSAYQLFGPWAFGGTSEAGSSAPIPWKNGYEALAQLDKDHDGWVSKDELQPLSLWFDHNRNGVSDDGEVVDIRVAGVTKLATSFDSIDQRTGDMISKYGYERETVEGTIRGRSIDWVSVSSTSKSELLEQVRAKALAQGENSHELSKNEAPTTITIDGESGSVNTRLAKEITGRWRWKLEDSVSREFGTEGFLEFDYSENGLSGTNIVLRPLFNPVSKEVTREVQLLPLGSLRLPENAEVMTFKVRSHDGSITTNSVTIDTRSGTMKGSSVQSFGTKEGPFTVTYKWTATREG